ncbi:MAG: hypothetical protein OK452_08825 [Thaumarchaeota archaeon]|nr:hypothetical protein [Nitrososphaerota archaeon]
MPDKADVLGAVLATIGFLGSGVYFFLVPGSGSASSGGPGVVGFLILTLPIYPYAAYWTLSIRHALAVPLYKRQALGIGFVILALWGTLGAFVVLPSGQPSPLVAFESFLAFYLLFIVLFYWIDASVLTSRRSDPLLRDTLYWSRIRIPLWVVIITTTLIPFTLLGYIGITSDTTIFNQLGAGTFGGPAISFALNVIINFPVVIPILGIVYLPIIAIRSKWDRSLRRHFEWFALAPLALLWIFFGPFSGTNSLAGDASNGLVLAIAGYALYRSARSLAPINRLQAVESETISVADVGIS